MLPHQQEPINQEPGAIIESTLSKTEQFIETNGKNLLIALAVVILVVGGYYGHKYLWSAPRGVQASNMMFSAERQFDIDSFSLALNGDGNNAGFLEVVSEYGDTPQGNIASHYAGVCYLYLNDLDKALEYLTQYNVTDGIPNATINAQNRGLIGDVYSQKGDFESAITNYIKAIEVSDNALTAPVYLKKAGLVYIKLGKNKEALDVFTQIEVNYPTSMEGRDIAKYIGQVEQK